MKSIIIALALALTCSGCVAVWGQSYKITVQDSNNITIRYDTALTSSPSIQKIAKTHCNQFNKSIEILYSKMPGFLLGIIEESYSCVTKPNQID